MSCFLKTILLLSLATSSASTFGCARQAEVPEVDPKSLPTAPVNPFKSKGKTMNNFDEHPVQQPADVGAVTDDMSKMKDAADEIIAKSVADLQQGKEVQLLLREGVRAILTAMPPKFGPANAWLFGERDKKIRKLCLELGLKIGDCVEVILDEQSKLP